MKTRHIAFLGFTASSFLAMTLAGCSADAPAAKKPTKDGGTSTTATGAGGAGNPTTGGGSGTDTNPTTGGAGTGVSMDPDASLGACTQPDKTVKAVVAMDVLSDFEGAAPSAIMNVTPGGGWYSYKDTETGVTFTPDPASWMVESPGNGGSMAAVHAAGTGFMGPASGTNWGAGTGFSPGMSIAGGLASGSGMTPMPTDLGMYTGISFFAKSSMMSDISVQFATPDTDPNYCSCATTMTCYTTHTAVVPMVAAAWTKYTVKFADLKQPTYDMTPVPFDPTSVVTINFASNGPLAAFDFWLDDITLVK